MERHYLHSLAPGYDKDQVLHDLMTTFGEDVWNFAFLITRRGDVADDISQDVFVAVYRSMYSFRSEGSVKSWLLTITRNKCLNYLKSSFIRKVTLADVLIPRNGSSPSAEHVWFDRMETTSLWSLVAGLPRKFREVIVLFYHYEIPISEMADLLQVSEGTVKSRLHRAKARISKMLLTEEEGGAGDGTN